MVEYRGSFRERYFMIVGTVLLETLRYHKYLHFPAQHSLLLHSQEQMSDSIICNIYTLGTHICLRYRFS